MIYAPGIDDNDAIWLVLDAIVTAINSLFMELYSEHENYDSRQGVSYITGAPF